MIFILVFLLILASVFVGILANNWYQGRKMDKKNREYFNYKSTLKP